MELVEHALRLIGLPDLREEVVAALVVLGVSGDPTCHQVTAGICAGLMLRSGIPRPAVMRTLHELASVPTGGYNNDGTVALFDGETVYAPNDGDGVFFTIADLRPLPGASIRPPIVTAVFSLARLSEVVTAAAAKDGG